MAADTNSTTGAVERTGGAGSLSPAAIVLVIGVPAGELGSLLRVLTGLPAEAGLAVVLAVQHPETFDENGFRRMLGARADTLVVLDRMRAALRVA